MINDIKYKLNLSIKYLVMKYITFEKAKFPKFKIIKQF